MVQGRERALLGAHRDPGVSARPQARVAVVGRPRGGADRRDPVVDLGRDGDDGEHGVLRRRVGALRDDARARAADRPPAARAARRDRGGVPHALAARRAVRRLARWRSVSTGGSARPRDRAAVPTGDACGRARSHWSRAPRVPGRTARGAPRRATRSAPTGSSGAATTRSVSRSGSSTTSRTSSSTSP